MWILSTIFMWRHRYKTKYNKPLRQVANSEVGWLPHCKCCLCSLERKKRNVIFCYFSWQYITNFGEIAKLRPKFPHKISCEKAYKLVQDMVYILLHMKKWLHQQWRPVVLLLESSSWFVSSGGKQVLSYRTCKKSEQINRTHKKMYMKALHSTTNNTQIYKTTTNTYQLK